jgi:hypothetical protein
MKRKTCLRPLPDIGFHVTEDDVPYRTKRKGHS